MPPLWARCGKADPPSHTGIYTQHRTRHGVKCTRPPPFVECAKSPNFPLWTAWPDGSGNPLSINPGPSVLSGGRTDKAGSGTRAGPVDSKHRGVQILPGLSLSPSTDNRLTVYKGRTWTRLRRPHGDPFYSSISVERRETLVPVLITRTRCCNQQPFLANVPP